MNHISSYGAAIAALGLATTLAAVSGGASSARAEPAPPAATEPAIDPLFTQPYIDIDEWRDAPVRHRYVHGGFKGTETRFSFYLPPKGQYQGRFFQHFTPAPDNENLAQAVPPGEENKVGFALSSGGYFVETNGGGRGASGGPGMAPDPTVGAWRANAAAAQYSRVVALKMYGGKRPYGYAYGGSGGAFRTVGSFENTRSVWDGVVPYVLGSSNATPSNFTVRMQAMRVLDARFPQIVDAVEPGGSGDPYAGLDAEETMALREATRMGFPVESWFGWRTMGVHAFPAVYGGMLLTDPTYFTEFWTKPGYLGFDHPEYFTRARIQQSARVIAPITAAEAARLGLKTSIVNGTVNGGVDNAFGSLQGKGGTRVVAFRLDGTHPDIQFLGGDLLVTGGAAKGARLSLSRVQNDMVVLGVVDEAVLAKVAAGDPVTVDNSNFLAAQSYHRHQVPGPEFIGWNQFRGPDGKPLYPQRPRLLGPLFTSGAAGALPTGNWEGKMILVESLWDREAFAWQADWYRGLVRQHFGATTDDHFRVWFTDHALHGDSTVQEDPTHTVSYLGVLYQALRDLSAWVEQGTPPPASTAYRIEDARVVVPDDATARRGIQPVVSLRSAGRIKTEAHVGRPVRFTGRLAVPPGAGMLVDAQWDFDGTGKFAEHTDVPKGARQLTVTTTHVFDRPGTYFPTLRGISQRQGDPVATYGQIQNLGRMRVVVLP